MKIWCNTEKLCAYTAKRFHPPSLGGKQMSSIWPIRTFFYFWHFHLSPPICLQLFSIRSICSDMFSEDFSPGLSDPSRAEPNGKGLPAWSRVSLPGSWESMDVILAKEKWLPWIFYQVTMERKGCSMYSVNFCTLLYSSSWTGFCLFGRLLTGPKIRL